MSDGGSHCLDCPCNTSPDCPIDNLKAEIDTLHAFIEAQEVRADEYTQMSAKLAILMASCISEASTLKNIAVYCDNNVAEHLLRVADRLLSFLKKDKTS